MLSPCGLWHTACLGYVHITAGSRTACGHAATAELSCPLLCCQGPAYMSSVLGALTQLSVMSANALVTGAWQGRSNLHAESVWFLAHCPTWVQVLAAGSRAACGHAALAKLRCLLFMLAGQSQ